MSDIVKRLESVNSEQDNLAIIFQWVKQGIINKRKDFKEVIEYEYNRRN